MASLSSVINPRLLNSLRSHSSNSWYFTAAVTLSTLNLPHEISHVYLAALNDAGPLAPSSLPFDEAKRFPFHAEHLTISRRTREALIKSTAIIGLPRTINSLLSLQRATPPYLLDPPMQPSPTGRSLELNALSSSPTLHRGSQFFANTYGKVAARVMGQMDRCGTEDLGLSARLIYGYLLSNETVLARKETSFCLIAGLIPQDVNPQLKGHLKGALNNGASLEEIRAVRNATVELCEAAGMKPISESQGGCGAWSQDVATI